MKSLTLTVSGSIIASLYEGTLTPVQPAQQVTIGEIPDLNPNWSRALQLSTQALYVKRGTVGVAIPLTDLVRLALMLEPTLTWAPLSEAEPESLSVDSGAPAVFVFDVVSELDVTYQWQINVGSGWVNVDETGVFSGSTTSTLTISDTTELTSGWQFRCIATNAAGSTTSDAATLTLT